MVEIIHEREVSEGGNGKCRVRWFSLGVWVPQGSVLGSILYCMHTNMVGGIVARHGINHHCYADDIHIYLTVDRDESIVAALPKVELCVAEVAAWLTNNNLKLNMQKSEAIIFSSVKKRNSLPADWCITIADHHIQHSSCTRRLCVIFDCNLRMEQQTANMVKVCYYQTIHTGQIRLHQTNKSCKILVHALMASHLDNGNSLVYVYQKARSNYCKGGQNCKMTRTKKYEPITPVL